VLNALLAGACCCFAWAVIAFLMLSMYPSQVKALSSVVVANMVDHYGEHWENPVTGALGDELWSVVSVEITIKFSMMGTLVNVLLMGVVCVGLNLRLAAGTCTAVIVGHIIIETLMSNSEPRNNLHLVSALIATIGFAAIYDKQRRTMWIMGLRKVQEQEVMSTQLQQTKAEAHSSALRALSDELKGVGVNSEQEVMHAMQLIQEPNMKRGGGACSAGCAGWRIAMTVLESLGRASADCSHLAFALRGLQIEASVSVGTYAPRAMLFDGTTLLRKLCDQCPSTTVTDCPHQCLLMGDEAGVYHVLHCAVLNAMSHGEADTVVSLQLELAADESVFTVLHKPGTNHSHALALQAQHGKNFLMEPDFELSALDLDEAESDKFRGYQQMGSILAAMGTQGVLTFTPNSVRLCFHVTNIVESGAAAAEPESKADYKCDVPESKADYKADVPEEQS